MKILRLTVLSLILSAAVFQSVLSETDTLRMIGLLDVRSYSCPEQHLPDVQKIIFKNDSAAIPVDPNVNHERTELRCAPDQHLCT